MPTTDELSVMIAEAREKSGKATEGPWGTGPPIIPVDYSGPPPEVPYGTTKDSEFRLRVVGGKGRWSPSMRITLYDFIADVGLPEDRDFITYARTAVPAFAAALERVREALVEIDHLADEETNGEQWGLRKALDLLEVALKGEG